MRFDLLRERRRDVDRARRETAVVLRAADKRIVASAVPVAEVGRPVEVRHVTRVRELRHERDVVEAVVIADEGTSRVAVLRKTDVVIHVRPRPEVLRRREEHRERTRRVPPVVRLHQQHVAVRSLRERGIEVTPAGTRQQLAAAPVSEVRRLERPDRVAGIAAILPLRARHKHLVVLAIGGEVVAVLPKRREDLPRLYVADARADLLARRVKSARRIDELHPHQPALEDERRHLAVGGDRPRLADRRIARAHLGRQTRLRHGVGRRRRGRRGDPEELGLQRLVQRGGEDE